jgi:hypothetical protein
MRNIEGNLEIIKKYSNGEEVVVFNEHNVIVSGMGLALNLLFSGSGSDTITDYQISRAQLGTGANSEVSSTYSLATSIPRSEMYTSGDSGVLALSGTQYTTTDTTVANQVFVLIPHSKVTRVNKNSVRYTIVIDEVPLAGVALTEIGLFTKNPFGAAQTQSVLAAYKTFGSITKSSDFSLIFNWTLTF